MDEVVAAGKREERVQQCGSGAALGDNLIEVIAVFAFSAVALKRKLRGSEDDGDRSAQIVRGVGRKLAEPRDGALRP